MYSTGFGGIWNHSRKGNGEAKTLNFLIAGIYRMRLSIPRRPTVIRTLRQTFLIIGSTKSAVLIGSMAVSMVQLRHMRMIVCERNVPMRMCVWLQNHVRRLMVMFMMVRMHVLVVMLRQLMQVEMTVVFG